MKSPVGLSVPPETESFAPGRLKQIGVMGEDRMVALPFWFMMGVIVRCTIHSNVIIQPKVVDGGRLTPRTHNKVFHVILVPAIVLFSRSVHAGSFRYSDQD